MGYTNVNRSWAALALLTGVLVTGCDGASQRGVDASSRPVDTVSTAVSRGEDRITPAQLADRMVSGARAVAVFDLRSREDFAAGHIRDARHLPLAEALSKTGRDHLRGAAVIVVYAEDSAPAAQAAVLLRLAGLETYFLEGGYRGWLGYLGEGPAGADRPAIDRKRLAAACRESPAWGEARAAGFVPAASAAEPPAAPVTPPPSAGPPASSSPPASPPPTPAPPAFTPPVAPVEGPAASPAPAPGGGGGLITNEGC